MLILSLPAAWCCKQWSYEWIEWTKTVKLQTVKPNHSALFPLWSWAKLSSFIMVGILTLRIRYVLVGRCNVYSVLVWFHGLGSTCLLNLPEWSKNKTKKNQKTCIWIERKRGRVKVRDRWSKNKPSTDLRNISCSCSRIEWMHIVTWGSRGVRQ